ncbi:hypothetical protein SARC_10292 [Sphaeroforma arctica JP610]|uniref:t-SNARE coiled-coil homology domain-containing protein n=1 Tax=Sphaeroforma arctica JP610 TaxID=667725 RepID=A0A0L0FKF3_9EUKA|nr:hypothetical protein SARC_10292 [Sphaeroforma arctica JP610]KNC77240.1 hypothetical protein SARC_10292 [Sphaeroforma arctica JP610]|eukprot:XP_014151142.1 hypothetical protein SARC_10292 [Sphaeroforma arctica JP610]
MSYGRGGGSSSNGFNEDRESMLQSERRERLMENENDQIAIELSNKVGALKNLTRGIHSDVQEHNSFLDSLQDKFGESGRVLGGAMEKLTELVSSGSGMSICRIVGICTALFCVLYWILK